MILDSIFAPQNLELKFNLGIAPNFSTKGKMKFTFEDFHKMFDEGQIPSYENVSEYYNSLSTLKRVGLISNIEQLYAKRINNTISQVVKQLVVLEFISAMKECCINSEEITSSFSALFDFSEAKVSYPHLHQEIEKIGNVQLCHLFISYFPDIAKPGSDNSSFEVLHTVRQKFLDALSIFGLPEKLPSKMNHCSNSYKNFLAHGIFNYSVSSTQSLSTREEGFQESQRRVLELLCQVVLDLWKEEITRKCKSNCNTKNTAGAVEVEVEDITLEGLPEILSPFELTTSDNNSESLSSSDFKTLGSFNLNSDEDTETSLENRTISSTMEQHFSSILLNQVSGECNNESSVKGCYEGNFHIQPKARHHVEMLTPSRQRRKAHKRSASDKNSKEKILLSLPKDSPIHISIQQLKAELDKFLGFSAPISTKDVLHPISTKDEAVELELTLV